MKIEDNQVVEIDDVKKSGISSNTKKISKNVVEVTEKNKDSERKHEKKIVNKVNYKIDNNKYKYIMFFLLGFVLAFAGFYSFNDYIVSNESNVSVINEKGITKGISNIYDAVVYIENYSNEKLISSGTGFIYKKENGKAYILTNNHVVSDSDSLKVVLSGNEKVTAKFLGGDEYLDVACLSIDDKYVKKVASFGSSLSLELGSTLFTVGSPVGDEYRGTVTRGILSGKDRLVTVAINSNGSDYVMKVIQTDAAMNPGNSGGPLCNANGEVIGINSLKLVKNEIEGMGFAIAIEDVKEHLDTFEKGKKINRPYLGISMINLDDKTNLFNYGLDKIDTDLKEGIVIESVDQNSVSHGKIYKNDIVTKVNGISVSDTAYFRYELYKYEAGDKVTITVERNGKLVDVTLVLQSKNDNNNK